jgi:membrane protease YdiL (CAAX protease family)
VTGVAPSDDPARKAGDRFADDLRGFGPLGILAIIVILAGNLLLSPLSALLVLVWARLSRTPWLDLGFVRPRSWLRVVAGGIVVGVALKLVMKALVMPMLGADPINHAFHHLVGNTAALPAMMFQVMVGAGFGEETVFRGYFFERLGRLLGRSRWATAAIVSITSVVFGMLHYSGQGLAGAQQATIMGLTFGTIYAITRRIWLPIIVHAAFDVAAVLIIYWDLETAIAHAVFK